MKPTDITKKIKDTVWARDYQRCVLCGSNQAMPNAHWLSRAHGGLGIEENIITLCNDCHRRLDQSVERKELKETLKCYLKKKYPNWDENKLNHWRK